MLFVFITTILLGLSIIGYVYCWDLNVILFLLGLWIGFLLNLVSQNINKPKLHIINPDDSINSIADRGVRWKFLHLQIKNVKQNAFMEFLFGSRALLFTSAKITFLEPQTNEELFSLEGRWASTGEPLSLVPVTIEGSTTSVQPVFDYSKVPNLRFEHILPGNYVNLAIAVKVEGQDEFFGFSNYSYSAPASPLPWQIDDFRIPNKSAFILVEVITGTGEKAVGKFKIDNPDKNLNSFKILER